MANRIYLEAFSDRNCTMDGIAIGEAHNKFPLLWAALFDLDDLVIESQEEQATHYLRTETKIALERLTSRLDVLKTIFPESAWEYFNNWKELISSLKLPYIQVLIEEYIWFFGREKFIDEFRIIFKFDIDSILHMIDDCSLRDDLIGGLVGYIEDELDWENKSDLYVIIYNDYSMDILSKKIPRIVCELEIESQMIILASIQAFAKHSKLSFDEILDKSLYLERTETHNSGMVICRYDDNNTSKYVFEPLSYYYKPEKNGFSMEYSDKLIHYSPSFYDLMFFQGGFSDELIEELVDKQIAYKLYLENGVYSLGYRHKGFSEVCEYYLESQSDPIV